MNILITNLHSARNLGDAAILEVTLKGLIQVFPNATITLAANDPDSWQIYASAQTTILPSLCTWAADCKYGDWRRISFRTPYYLFLLFISFIAFRLLGFRFLFGNQKQRALLIAYFEADLILSCGGGNFYAHHSPSPALIWALITLGFALGLNKTIIMLPQSIGPIEGRVQQWFTRLILGHVSCMMLREPKSIEYISQQLNISLLPVLMPDLAFGLAKGECENKTIMNDPLMKIGVSVIDRHAQESRFNFQNKYEDALVNLIISFDKKNDISVYIFVQARGPSKDQDDTHAAHRLYKRIQGLKHIHILDQFEYPLQLKAAYGEMDIVIGSRLHSGVFALSCGVPLLLISYQPKASGTMELFDLDKYCLQINNLSNESLIMTFDDLVEMDGIV